VTIELSNQYSGDFNSSEASDIEYSDASNYDDWVGCVIEYIKTNSVTI
jgi:hypothetical protein